MDLLNTEARRLLELLAQQVDEPLDGVAFDKIETWTEGVMSKRFLADKYREMEKGEDPISFQNSKLDPVLKQLGFESVRKFRQFLAQPIPEVLESCFGNWISLVRQNSFDGYLYQSPVRIYREQHEARFELRGPNYPYGGKMAYRNGCLTVLFEGSSGKEFHHVYKIGNRKRPALLQGIYSGISTGDDPIGGRCVLYRTVEAFEDIPNQQLTVKDLLQSKDEMEAALGQYFEAFERNNLRLNPIVSFGPEDLRNPW